MYNPHTLALKLLPKAQLLGRSDLTWLAFREMSELADPYGPRIGSGTTDPGSETAADGDYYYNTDTDFFFGPKASGSWPAGISLEEYPENQSKGAVGISIDGSGSAITTGQKGYITIPYSGTISGWDLLADVSGSCIIDLRKEPYPDFPPDEEDSICGETPPELDDQQKNTSSSLSGWTTAVSEGDIIGFHVVSASGVGRINLTIKILKS